MSSWYWHLTDEQKAKVEVWMENLDTPLGTYDGASGGRFSYIETPTSLGVCHHIRDNMAKDKANAELDLTDTSDW